MAAPEAEGVAVRQLDGAQAAALVEGLAEVLIDCVEGGASVSFLWPLARGKALDFRRGVAEGVAPGERALFVAETPPWCRTSADARRRLLRDDLLPQAARP